VQDYRLVWQGSGLFLLRLRRRQYKSGVGSGLAYLISLKSIKIKDLENP